MTPSQQTCRSIMTPNPVTIRRDRTVGDALRMLIEGRLLALPVIDERGRYLGMFLRSRLVALLLPRIVQLEERLPEVSRLIEVGFVSDTLDDVHDRFMTVANDRVERYIQQDTPILRPDTPVMNAVLFLYRTRTYLPVVDETTSQLIGVVSTWDILDRIAGKST